MVAGGIQDALFATIAFYFLLTGLEKRSTLRLVLSALVIGSHVYIYMGARLVILLIPVYILALLLVEPKTVKENALNLVAFAVMLAILIVPMGVWALDHPADFMARANQVGVFQSGWIASEAVKLNQTQQHILLNLLLQALLDRELLSGDGVLQLSAADARFPVGRDIHAGDRLFTVSRL